MSTCLERHSQDKNKSPGPLRGPSSFAEVAKARESRALSPPLWKRGAGGMSTCLERNSQGESKSIGPPPLAKGAMAGRESKAMGVMQ